MELIFENHCTYTFRYYLQLKRKTMDRSFIHTCQGLLLILATVSVLGAVKGWGLLTVTGIALFIFVAYRLFGTPVRLAAYSTKKNREVQGGDAQTVNRFYEDQVIAVNLVTKGKTTIPYSEVLSLLQTKNLYIIGMKKGLVLLIDKNGFTKGNRESFRSFLKEKCINAEVKI